MNALKQDKGFTLIEVIASFVLLAILATVITSLFSNGFRSITKFGTRSEKMLVARQNIEGATLGTDGNITVNRISGSGPPAIKFHGETVSEPIAGTSGSKMTVFISTPPLWAAAVNYTLNDHVRYNNKNYTCIRPHISDATNKPLSSGSPWVEY
ncbi:carbohydrate-binding protein [Paenibacillus pini]|uniref:Chitin-binding type-3 domain-containing protein n=1 Tax=Paenibacillus pini JCM 16418 TaxID=1236976 RepID=W7YNS6_9BACL|nr:carbohydrate-binding protein [Paenibacillus pini]GAF09268.1 hypothetical protein JCM16418_3394 [Paenibacillus pini JCM 16418]